VNRKQWIIVGVIIIALIMGMLFLLNNRPDSTAPMFDGPVSNLAYCTDEQVKPCVVSFGIDADGNMLVNLLLPDLFYPDFYLKITRDELDISYECQRIAASLNNAYCIGENLPPGEVLHLMLISTKDEVLLAEGSLSIIGLAFPTLEIVISTAVPTMSPGPTPTDFFDFVLPTQTPVQFPTQVSTPPSYP